MEDYGVQKEGAVKVEFLSKGRLGMKASLRTAGEGVEGGGGKN